MDEDLSGNNLLMLHTCGIPGNPLPPGLALLE